MWHIIGTPDFRSGKIHWSHTKTASWDDKEGVKIVFELLPRFSKIQRHLAIMQIRQILEENDVPWLIPGVKEWTLYLDKLKTFIPELSSLTWFKGNFSIEPEFEPEDRLELGKPLYDAKLAFYIYPEDIKKIIMPLEPPIEIQESLTHFKDDYPDPNKVAFIMMRFGETKAHDEIVKAIRSALGSHRIVGIRADEKRYHDDLFYNVLTYLYGCGFGVTVFERIEVEDFNPNVSLEVGYLLALKKPVCLLKDRTIKILHTDLVGKLYEEFDPQDPMKAIPDKINQWLLDKRIV
ncbi:MAG: hypothetical protein O8C62_06335 [Candidatus Methanoperedens sp.]|nr:hypothetical protein [Candidatus Methanoperedens sp.]